MAQFSQSSEEFLRSLETILEQDPEYRNDALSRVTTNLESCITRGNVDTAIKAAQLLGTAAGKQKDWQTPFREVGILEYVVDHLDSPETSVELAKQYLRIIGNSVAYNDINREAVTPGMPKLITCLDREILRTTALAVMFNLCNDYDPAHAGAAVLRLDSIIAERLVSEELPEEALDYATDLMTWATEKLTPIQIKDDKSLTTFNNILNVVLHCDEDHYHEYLALVTYYLQEPEFQQKVAAPETVEKLFDLMLDYERRLTSKETNAVFQELTTHKEPEKASSEDSSVLLLVQLVNGLSAVSAYDAFVREFSTSSPLVEKITSKIRSSTTSPSTVCACVMFGNFATSDQVCIHVVNEMGLHLPLIQILSFGDEPALLFAAAGFMRHLAFPATNRLILAQAGLIDSCCHLLTKGDPSIRGEAAAILGKIVTHNLANTMKIVCTPVPNGITLAQVPEVDQPENPTLLYHIITQALASSAPLPSTSMKNAMIEIGRTLITILRNLRQQTLTEENKEDAEVIAREFYQTPLVARPIARLVRQRFYADARAEGLLGLGLLSQTPEGAAAVVDEMKADGGLLNAVNEFAAEQMKEESGQQSGMTSGRNCQNAMVFLHALAQNGKSAMSTDMKSSVESMLAGLGKLVV